jgi:hypothetical protein
MMIADPLDHSVHLLNLHLFINDHNILATHRRRLAVRSKIPLQSHHIGIDPEFPNWRKTPPRVAVEKLRDHYINSIEANHDFVGIVDGNIGGTSPLHLSKAFDLIAFIEYAEQVLYGEQFSLGSRD